MIGFLLGNWKLLSGLVIGATLAGYVGVLKLDNTSLRSTQALLQADLANALGRYETCDARLRNILEARNDAETAADPDFTPPAEWLRDPATGADSPAQ